MQRTDHTLAENVFRRLEGQEYFKQFVGDYYRKTPERIDTIVPFVIEIEEARIDYAHNAYVQGVQKFEVVLESGDPDHYKRAGALLHSLYLSKPIIDAIPTEDLDGIDTLDQPIGVSYKQAEEKLAFANLYCQFHNELTAFALAYDCCRLYEPDPTPIDLDYLKTVCVYLKGNANLSVESLFMLFKSLMWK